MDSIRGEKGRQKANPKSRSLFRGICLFLALTLLGVLAGGYLNRVELHRNRLQFDKRVQMLEEESRLLLQEPRHDISQQKLRLAQKRTELEAAFSQVDLQHEPWAKALSGRALKVLGQHRQSEELLVSAWKDGVRNRELVLSYAGLVLQSAIINEISVLEFRQLGDMVQHMALPNDRDEVLFRTLLLLARGRFEEVLESSSGILQPENAWLKSAVEVVSYCGLGDIKMKNGRFESAQVEYRLAVLVAEKMVRLQPSNPHAYLTLAHLHCRMYDAQVKEKGESLSNYLDGALSAVQMAMIVEPDNLDAADLYRIIQKTQNGHKI